MLETRCRLAAFVVIFASTVATAIADAGVDDFFLFAPSPIYQVGFQGVDVGLADLDGDIDLAMTNELSDSVTVLLNQTGVIPCPGDVNNENVVDLADLDAVLANFGVSCP